LRNTCRGPQKSLPQRTFHPTNHVQQEIHPTDNLSQSVKKNGVGEARRRGRQRRGRPPSEARHRPCGTRCRPAPAPAPFPVTRHSSQRIPLLQMTHRDRKDRDLQSSHAVGRVRGCLKSKKTLKKRQALNTQSFKVVEDEDVDGTCCSARGVCRTAQVSVIGRSDSGRAPQRHITSSTST